MNAILLGKRKYNHLIYKLQEDRAILFTYVCVGCMCK